MQWSLKSSTSYNVQYLYIDNVLKEELCTMTLGGHAINNLTLLQSSIYKVI